MRDLRLIGTTVDFPDVEQDQDDRAHHMRNLLKVLEGSKEELYITEAIWNDGNYKTEASRKRATTNGKIQSYAQQNVRKRYEKDENELVEPTNLSLCVWDPAVLAIADEVYLKTFRPAAWAKFGQWEHKLWKEAMSKYVALVTPRLEQVWELRGEDFGETEHDADDATAVREAPDKLKWLQKLQQLDARPLKAPLLCDRFMEDFSNVIAGAESGFKLVSEYLFRESFYAPVRANAVRLRPRNHMDNCTDASRLRSRTRLGYCANAGELRPRITQDHAHQREGATHHLARTQPPCVGAYNPMSYANIFSAHTYA